MTRTYRYDDLAGLRQAVTGQWGSWSEPVTVDQAMIDAFAALTGDHQWIHVDPERAARDSPFGTTIAHGFLVLSLLPRVTTQPVTVGGHSSALNYGADKVRFVAPVPAGAALHGRTRLAAVEDRGGSTLLTTEVEVAVVGAAKPSLLYGMMVLYRGAPPAERPPTAAAAR